MNRAILMSIKPEWTGLIFAGTKTVEIRKNKPNIKPPFKVYIYCTAPNTKNPCKLLEIHDSNGKIHKGNGKVVGEFVCDSIYPIGYTIDGFADIIDVKETCLSPSDFVKYGKGKPLYGWHISNLKIYDSPKEIGEFRRECLEDLYCESCALYSNYAEKCENEALYLKRPPQSWCYVEEVEE